MKAKKKEVLYAAIYILPSFLLISFFSLIPLVMNVYYSFTKYNVLQPAEWVGLTNYTRILKDVYVWDSLKNTAIFTIVTVPIQTSISLILAVVIKENMPKRIGNFIKSSLFVPVIASSVLIGSLWSVILQYNGVLNGFLSLFKVAPINWLGGQVTSLLSICMVSIWKNIGYFLVIYFAGVLSVPQSYYEAANVDGATYMQKFRFITLPCLKNITYLVVTLGTIWSFQVFDLVQIMTNGGPGRSTVTLVLTIYNAAFKEFNMGYASALAMVMLAFVLIISIVQKLVFKDDVEE
ncbi:MAG: sugar ABC transporter permease [Eubacteriales bacterium]